MSSLKLYIYDHCPFCARVRLILGLKKIDHELIFLANHDEHTPISLIGAKQVPILVLPSGQTMGESMDIVKYLDEHYGDDPMLAPASGRQDLQQWISDATQPFLQLTHARFHRTPLAEFARIASRDYYRHKKEHHLGASFEELLARTPELVAQANALLERLDGLLQTSTTVNATVSYDDLDIATRLRGITIVQGLRWPPKVRAYLDHYAREGDVQCFDRCAN